MTRDAINARARWGTHARRATYRTGRWVLARTTQTVTAEGRGGYAVRPLRTLWEHTQEDATCWEDVEAKTEGPNQAGMNDRMCAHSHEG